MIRRTLIKLLFQTTQPPTKFISCPVCKTPGKADRLWFVQTAMGDMVSLSPTLKVVADDSNERLKVWACEKCGTLFTNPRGNTQG